MRTIQGAQSQQIILILHQYKLTNYYIAKIIGVHQSYLTRWQDYKHGHVPSLKYRIALKVILQLVLECTEEHGKVIKEVIQQKYKRSIAKTMSKLLSD